MKYLRYSGEFVAIGGVTWRAEIMQEAMQAYASVGSLEFDGDSPLVLEWGREDKEVPVQGSTATLRLNSPGDRTYEDLYTIEAGAIRLDVYRAGVLYWSGALDPEFYEEPYDSGKNYTVELLFSDFGILDRKKYTLTGLQTLRAIVLHALSESAVLYTSLDTSMVSTTFDDSAAITNGGLSVRSDNFTDEEGETMTLREALEGILQPLALRMVQRAGNIYIYDLNGLYGSSAVQAITWHAGGAMGTDKVANRIVVTFSPYSSADLLDGELEYGGKYDAGHTNLASAAPTAAAAYGEYYSYYPDYSDESRQGSSWDYDLIDFTIFLHSSAQGLAAIGTGCMYFHIMPMLGGSEADGVAYAFRTGGHGGISTGWPVWKCHTSVPRAGTSLVLRTEKVFLPKMDSSDATGYRVRLTEEILIDARYNPFSGSTEGNDEGNDETLKVRSGWVFIPARVTLYDASGTALYHYSNRTAATGGTKGHLGYAAGSWVAGADTDGDCWLEYYNAEELEEDCGLRGWKGNRHCIGRPDGEGGRADTEIYKSFTEMDDGEYMPYPPVGGYLQVEILSGLYGYDYGDDCAWASTDSSWDAQGIYGKLRWALYKAPAVTVVNRNVLYDGAELEDIEYSGTVNAAAKEEISIDTICGTSDRACPTARGVYARTSTGEQVQTLTRAGVSDHPENLLIGTLCSQYAGRKLLLSGTAAIDGGLHRYSEANYGDKRFMLMSDVQDCITGDTEAEYCEFAADNYEAE